MAQARGRRRDALARALDAIGTALASTLGPGQAAGSADAAERSGGAADRSGTPTARS